MTTTGAFNTKNPTIKRILREARELASLPTTDYTAAPLESNLFEWHFTLRGPPATPYASGLYHGRIVLPPTYPLRPPSFRFLTPSGRFEPNREICLSISGHHEESWQPAWGIRTALVAIRAFMEGDARGQVGGVDASAGVRERLAGESRGWRCGVCGRSCAEILEERDREVGAMEKEGGKKVDEAVPAELRLQFREDLGKGVEPKEKTEVDTLAQVPSTDIPPSSAAPAALGNARVEQRSMQPTRTVPLQTNQPRRPQDDRILNRLDMAIAVFASALAYMVVRKLASWI